MYPIILIQAWTIHTALLIECDFAGKRLKSLYYINIKNTCQRAVSVKLLSIWAVTEFVVQDVHHPTAESSMLSLQI